MCVCLQERFKSVEARVLSKGASLKSTILLAVVAGVLTGCHTFNETDYIARLNDDPRVWPPVVAGQPFPVQMMNDPE